MTLAKDNELHEFTYIGYLIQTLKASPQNSFEAKTYLIEDRPTIIATYRVTLMTGKHFFSNSY